MNSKQKGLNKLLTNYSLDDLAKSFFVLNLWLPNIASQIKIQYLYVLLEEIYEQLSAENHIKSYDDFSTFSKKLFKLVPLFPTIEDYIPETGWNDIKYYFKKRFYKIFYGGDLSNPYDFYYSFEMVHSPLDQMYLEILKRSPLTELQFCLSLQDHILSNLKQQKSSIQEYIEPGYLEVPTKIFWKDATRFIDTYDHDYYSSVMLDNFTKVLTSIDVHTDMNTFVENAFKGRNCCYFFIRSEEKIYPVLPRNWLTVIYDKWGILLKDNLDEITKRLGKSKLNNIIGSRVGSFIRQRMYEDKVFTNSAPLKLDMMPPNDLIFTSIHSENKLYLIYTTPPIFSGNEFNTHIAKVLPKLKASLEQLKKNPFHLAQFVEEKVMEFRSEKKATLEPVLIIAIPSVISDIVIEIYKPDGIEFEIMTLDQLAGIFDEIETPQELNDFINYLNEEKANVRIAGLNSYLDRFGSFKDSHGVLIPGALEPTMIMLDCGWGSNYRFDSLKKFWAAYPEENLFGNPRSWTILEERKTANGLILKSKSFFCYAYIQKVGKTTFHINAPIHLMDTEDWKTADTLMQIIYDAIDIYQNILNNLDIAESHNMVHLFFCSSSVACNAQELSHIKYLAQDEMLWAIDSACICSGDFGIRIVYNKEKVTESLMNVKDRSLQVSLLIDTLKKLSKWYPEPNLDEIIAELINENGNKPRFGMFSVEKRASFPQNVRTLKPDDREYKLADKEIAKVAHNIVIEPGTYSAEDAKEILNQLRANVVEILDKKIKLYGLSNSLPILFEKSNALINDAWQNETQLKATKSLDLNYEPSEYSSESEKDFLHWIRVYRYIIEKFVQHQPSSTKDLKEYQLKEILALADRLLDLYAFSDFINYEMYSISVNINDEYIVTTKDVTNDISRMQKEYGEEQAKINLGIIGNKDDTADSNIPIEEYLSELDAAFKKDFGFGLKNLINVQQVLALWAESARIPEATYYFADIDQITKTCQKNIIGYEPSETEAILDFLTLKQNEILVVKGESLIPSDLPVWEHNKRLARFDIRPLIKVHDKYYWGPHSIERTSRIWLGISIKHRLPSDFDAPTVKAVLLKGHQNLERNLVAKTKEIVSRFTDEIKTDVYPHTYDSSISDIGDYDVIAYLKDKNILLNIESKIIDPPHSNKDSGRMQRKIYGSKKTDGSFKKAYLQHVEERATYLSINGQKLLTNLGWTPPSKMPTVVSIFVTKMGSWWTKHPPIPTDVHFVEIMLLNDFISKL